MKQLSEATYRIQHIHNKAKRVVVHFDRLKRCHPQTRLNTRNLESETVAQQEETVNQPAEFPDSNHAHRHLFGAELQMIEPMNVRLNCLHQPLESDDTNHQDTQHVRDVHLTFIQVNTGRIPQKGELCSESVINNYVISVVLHTARLNRPIEFVGLYVVVMYRIM